MTDELRILEKLVEIFGQSSSPDSGLPDPALIIPSMPFNESIVVSDVNQYVQLVPADPTRWLVAVSDGSTVPMFISSVAHDPVTPGGFAVQIGKEFMTKDYGSFVSSELYIWTSRGSVPISVITCSIRKVRNL